MSTTQNDWLDGDSKEDRAIRHLVETTDVSPAQAKELIEKHGTDIDELTRIASTIKAES